MRAPNKFELISLLSALLSSVGSAQPSYETYYRLVSNYPSNAELDWGQHPQGATHDEDHWYITQGEEGPTSSLWRIPVAHPLPTVSFLSLHDSATGVKMTQLQDAPAVAGERYDHFGDPAYHKVGEHGYVLVPIEGSDPSTGGGRGGIAVFRADETLAYVAHVALPLEKQWRASWCGIDPDGNLYTSNYDDVSLVHRYKVRWSMLEDTSPRLVLDYSFSLLLRDEAGSEFHLQNVQGGEITRDGALLYMVAKDIHVFNLATGRRLRQSTSGSGSFDFEIHPPLEVPEGLAIWDLDDGRAPGITGQLHVFMFGLGWFPGDYDDVYFKHYENAVYVDSASRETCQVMCCNDAVPPFPLCVPVPSCDLCLLDPLAYCVKECTPAPQDGSTSYPYRTVANAHAAAWSGAKLRLAAGSYPEGVILTKAIKLQADGGPATIGK